MRSKIFIGTLFLLIALLHTKIVGQDVVDTMQMVDNEEQINLISDPFEEEIIKISPFGRILIISNKSLQFNEGDYITLITANTKIARAISVKIKKDEAGIKIVKVYNKDLWKALKINQKLTLIKGDDSLYKPTPQGSTQGEKQKNPKNKNPEDLISDKDEILSEQQLLTKVDDQFEDEESQRRIKTDHLLTLSYGLIQSINSSGNPKSYTHYSGAWQFQFMDNFWGELGYGESVMPGFPSNSLNTKISQILFRVKYTFIGPSSTFLQPYAGLQIVKAICPAAGQSPLGTSSSTAPSSAQLKNEKDLLAKAQKRNFSVGLSLLKRLTPGWFIKGELGTDLITLGIAFEF